MADHNLYDGRADVPEPDRPTDEAVQGMLATPLMSLLQAVAGCGRSKDETFALVRSTLDRIEAEIGRPRPTTTSPAISSSCRWRS